MTLLEAIGPLVAGIVGGASLVVLFAAVGAYVIRKEIDEHRARKEYEEAVRLEAAARETRTGPEYFDIAAPKCRKRGRVHRRERATLPARRGDR